MTKEEIVEFFTDEANKPIFAEIAKAQGFETPESIQALKDNKAEILREKQIISDKLEESRKTVDTLNKSGQKSVDDKAKAGEDFEPKYKELEDKYNRLDETHRKVSENYSSTLKSNKISEALDAAGYKEHKPLLKRVLEASTTTKQNEQGGFDVLYQMDGYPVSLDEYMKSTFPTSDAGVKYKDVPENKGGGSQNFNSSGGSSKTMKQSDFNKLGPVEQAQFMKQDGATTTQE